MGEMPRADGLRVTFWAAVLAAGLLVASATAGTPGVTYGADASKGCQPQSMVGQKDVCFYVFGNFDGTSHDTIVVHGAVDTITTAAGPVTSPDRGGGHG